MSFHSLDFVAFFLIVATVYWQLDRRNQNRLLLVAGYIFYGWVHPWFVTLLFASTTFDYWLGRRMEDDPGHRWRYLKLSLAGNLGLLGFFKYFNFFIENARAVLAAIGFTPAQGVLEIILPVGISFYTFQSLTYTVGVYRGRVRAERDFVDFAVFVSFFPQLVAGPIERAEHLLPQVKSDRVFSPQKAADGLMLVAWGFFKKLVIADNVGIIANKIFALEQPGFYLLWTGVLAFAIQIFADFSAYSDIARGTAKWLGFELMLNFDHPYLARSPRDFWHRWHISLSTWFRDYVYFPLGGSRGTPSRAATNIIATFLLSGLWHGASWNYALWGLYHGVLLAVTRPLGWLEQPRRGWGRVITALQMIVVFALVNIGWLMFRETNLHYLIRWFTLSPWASTPFDRQAAAYLFLMVALDSLPIWVHGIGARIAAMIRTRDAAEEGRVAWGQVWWQATAVCVLLAAVLVLRSRTSLDFIYFQF